MSPVELPPEYSDSVVLPTTYDVVWSLIPLVMLVFVWVFIATIEKRRGSNWPTVILWCVLATVLPIAGFIIWLICIAIKQSGSPSGATARPGESTAK